MIVIKNEKIRKLLRILLPFSVIPAAVLLGVLLLERDLHLLVSFLVALLSLLLFFCGFEKKKIGSRRLVIVAVMTALSVVGRMFPIIKPVTVFALIAGMYLGAEAGFLVGALSAFLSNFYFGQGPWTPFQMLAWGLIGFFAGLLTVPLKKSRLFLYFYAILAAVAFSMVMDVWTTLWVGGDFILSLYLSKILTALPHTVLYAVSNVIFLLLLRRPFGEKLERIKIKYGV